MLCLPALSPVPYLESRVVVSLWAGVETSFCVDSLVFEKRNMSIALPPQVKFFLSVLLPLGPFKEFLSSSEASMAGS